MHKWAKSMMECIKTKVDGIGIDNFDMEKLCELEKWTCVAEKIAEYDYYYNIVKAMEESGAEYGKDYDENGRFYTPTRMRRYEMSPKEYREHEPEYYRDMDRHTKGVMYYTDSNMNMSNNNRSNNNSRYDMAKRGYEDNKAMHPSDDSSNMKAMEEVISVFEEDMKGMKSKMSANEKTMARNKLTNLANMLV